MAGTRSQPATREEEMLSIEMPGLLEEHTRASVQCLLEIPDGRLVLSHCTPHTPSA